MIESFSSKKYSYLLHPSDRDWETKHPDILKEHLQKNISLETLVILNKILGFKNSFDKKLKDPVWESVSLRMCKYDPFIHIDVFHYKKLLKQIVCGEK